MGTHAFDARALCCMHTAPHVHRPDLAELTPSTPIIPGLAAPAPLGRYVVDEILGHERSGNGWLMDVQHCVGPPVRVRRSTLGNCDALIKYDLCNTYPYDQRQRPPQGPVAHPPSPAAPADAMAEPPMQGQPSPPPVPAGHQARKSRAPTPATHPSAEEAPLHTAIDTLHMQMETCVEAINALEHSMDSRVKNAMVEVAAAVQTAQEAMGTHQRLLQQMSAMRQQVDGIASQPCCGCSKLAADNRALAGQVTSLQADLASAQAQLTDDAGATCEGCAHLETRIQLLEASRQGALPTTHRVNPQVAPQTPSAVASVARQMMAQHKLREDKAKAAREQIRLDTNAQAGATLAPLGLAYTPPRPNLLDACEGNEMYTVLQAFGIDLVDNTPRPRLATIATLFGYTHTLDAAYTAPMTLPLQKHFVEGGYVTFGSATQRKERAALTQREVQEHAHVTGVLQVAGSNRPKRKLPQTTDGFNPPETFASFEKYMAAAHEHVSWMRRADADKAAQLMSYYEAVRKEWHTTTTFKGNLKILTEFCPRIREHLEHVGATDWILSRDDPHMAKLLTACKDQAEIEADRVRGTPPPVHPDREGAGRTLQGGNDGRKHAADPAVPLPTNAGDAIAQGWGAHNAPPGTQICVKNTFGTCTNPASGEGCISPDGQHRLHVCCFCGQTHPVGKDIKCPAPKRPSQ